jgi:hypothetical protein
MARCRRNRTRRNAGITRSVVTAAVAVLAGGFYSQTFAGVTPAQPKAGDPLSGLTAEQQFLFEEGKGEYSHILTIEEGRGPTMNKSGCVSCHANPLGGWGTITVTRFGMINKGVFDPLEELGGSLLQAEANSVECREEVPEGAHTALRVTNSSLAFGLIEAIPDGAIIANDDPDDLDGDGVSGRVHMVTAFEDPLRRGRQPLRAGRFGWKAQVATVLTFSADASLNEMGLTNRFVMAENAPNGDEEVLALCDTTLDPEDGPGEGGRHRIDRYTNFQRYLAAPPQTPKSGMAGEQIFMNIGCGKCHIPEWQTSRNPRLEEAIRGKTIKPYSDFLLHDMGMLGDGIVQGDASGQEFRTPTLWNLRTRDPMLHDGSIGGGPFEERVFLAIQAHDSTQSEAEESAEHFLGNNVESPELNLTQEQRDQLIKFLASLGLREFDSEGDELITIFDYYDFRTCFNAGGAVTPDDLCAIHDVDQDGDVDLDDFQTFLTVYEGVIEDCNNNGTVDLQEILLGQLPDSDDDGVADPSACTAVCVGDLDGSLETDGADLGLLLANWGGSGVGDLDASGEVDAADLGSLLAAWGACP